MSFISEYNRACICQWYRLRQLRLYTNIDDLCEGANRIIGPPDDSSSGGLSAADCVQILQSQNVRICAWRFKDAAWRSVAREIVDLKRKSPKITWKRHLKLIKSEYIKRRCPKYKSKQFWHGQLLEFYNTYAHCKPPSDLPI
ncbi:hypothetical protein IWW38_005267 [Coemansia aciculifera]|uniref:Uncharacterized protein n=1 Tax=Coemansia aciculifera TaxID=417176 RepID=A0ACC1LW76_9FUNG|nr:hypothetical protein IWW38_005267 [Coemansia aciculifera]